jgi:hypothetical protein
MDLAFDLPALAPAVLGDPVVSKNARIHRTVAGHEHRMCQRGRAAVPLAINALRVKLKRPSRTFFFSMRISHQKCFSFRKCSKLRLRGIDSARDRSGSGHGLLQGPLISNRDRLVAFYFEHRFGRIKAAWCLFYQILDKR